MASSSKNEEAEGEGESWPRADEFHPKEICEHSNGISASRGIGEAKMQWRVVKNKIELHKVVSEMREGQEILKHARMTVIIHVNARSTCEEVQASLTMVRTLNYSKVKRQASRHLFKPLTFEFTQVVGKDGSRCTSASYAKFRIFEWTCCERYPYRNTLTKIFRTKDIQTKRGPLYHACMSTRWKY